MTTGIKPFTISLFAVLAFNAGMVNAAPKPKAKATAISALAGQPVEVQAAALRDAALKSDIAYGFVADLTTRFGPRPAGGEAERKAAEWSAGELKRMGFENVHLQTFPLYGWERGAESIEITAPFPQKLVGVALGGSSAGVADAEAAMFETYQAFLDSKADLTGKIVVILQPMARASNGSGYGRMSGTVRSAGPGVAQRRGAVGYVLRSLGTETDRFAHAGATTWTDGKGIPSMAISPPDAEALNRILKLQRTGKAGPVRLRMASGAKFLGLGQSQNVVADLVGSEKPDEVIVIGGHIDSWDLGTGAIDDASGLAITMAAAKTMIDAGLRPKRTVRVVFWGAEEVSQPEGFGDAGGGKFRDAYKDKLSTFIAAGESDFGAGKIYSVSLMPTENRDFVTKLGNVLYPLAIYIDPKAVPTGGVDSGPLHASGVPAFDLEQDGYDYFDVHHTANDVIERIDPAQLKQNVAAWTATVWLMANMDVTFTRPEIKKPEIKK